MNAARIFARAAVCCASACSSPTSASAWAAVPRSAASHPARYPSPADTIASACAVLDGAAGSFSVHIGRDHLPGQQGASKQGSAKLETAARACLARQDTSLGPRSAPGSKKVRGGAAARKAGCLHRSHAGQSLASRITLPAARPWRLSIASSIIASAADISRLHTASPLGRKKISSPAPTTPRYRTARQSRRGESAVSGMAVHAGRGAD